MKRILVITDMRFQGSGYYSIFAPLLTILAEKYNIIVIGLGYEGQEHWYPFSIIPCKDVNDLYSIFHNLCMIDVTVPDVVIVGLDIPQQIQIYDQTSKYKKPYIAVTPLENPPLMMPWAAKLMTMDFVFFILELGKEAAQKAGLQNVSERPAGERLFARLKELNCGQSIWSQLEQSADDGVSNPCDCRPVHG